MIYDLVYNTRTELMVPALPENEETIFSFEDVEWAEYDWRILYNRHGFIIGGVCDY